MYRLLAIDLDGTLLTPERKITPRTRAAIQQAVASGMELVITTGQSYLALRSLCAGLPLTKPQVTCNGAVIVDPKDDTILHETLVPLSLVHDALAALQEKQFFRVYHTNTYVYAEQGTPGAEFWYLPPAPPTVIIEDVTTIYPQPCVKLMGVGEPANVLRSLPYFEERFAGQLYVTRAASDLLEFLHPDVSKGKALARVARMLDVAPEEIVAFGDNHNDIEMLRLAGLGIAMGNAADDVKAHADYVTQTNAEEGVAVALEEKVLPLLSSQV